MCIQSVDIQSYCCGVEVFVLNSAKLASVDSIGKISGKAFVIKPIGTAAYFLIRRKANADSTVLYFTVYKSFACGNYLGNAGFIIRTEQCRTVAHYHVLAYVAVVDHGQIFCRRILLS